jgi:hypothetical protein
MNDDKVPSGDLMRLETATNNTKDEVLIKPTKLIPTGVSCETPAGAAWLKNYLHPPTSNVVLDNAYCGYPDKSSQPSIKITAKGVEEFALHCTDVPAIPARKYLQLFFWGMNQQNCSWSFDSTTGNIPVLSDVILYNKTYNPSNWNKDMSVARRTFGSVSIYQDETDFSNRGTITVASYAPEFIDVVADSFALEQMQFNLLVRAKSAGDVWKFPGRLCTLVGGKHVDYISHMKSKNREDEPVLVGGLDVVTNSRFIIIDTLPKTMTEVLNLSGKSYTGMLKDGAFIVNRLFQDTNLYEKALPTVLNLIETSTGVVTTIANPVGGEWVSSNFMMTWVLMENLYAEAGNSANHVLYKFFNGFETIPELHSSLNAFTTPCAMEDSLAQRIASNVLHKAPDADVVASNSLGTILSAALSAAPQVIKWLGNVTGSVKKEEKTKVESKQKVEKHVNNELSELKGIVTELVKNMASMSAVPKGTARDRFFSSEPSNPSPQKSTRLHKKKKKKD